MKRVILFLSFVVLILSVVKAQDQITNLPTLYINTEGGKGIYDKENYVPGTVFIVSDNPEYALEAKSMGIRGRGNSTWGMAKKPYRIKFDKKTDLFGSKYKAKSWVLLANYADKTLMRNGLAFELSRFCGFEFSPMAVYADVVLNGTYLGNYMISDQMQVGKGRVDIDEMEAKDTEGDNLTGGYFLEIDGFGASEPVHFNTNKRLIITVKSPDEEVIQTSQLNYIKNYINTFEKALFASDFDNPDGGFRKWVDEKSIVDWYICSELTGNPDAFWSTYVYKKRGDDHLYFGPLWDFDIAFNNDNRLGDAVNKLMRSNAHEPRTWINRIWQAKWFQQAVYDRWCELFDSGLEDFMIGYIDRTSALLQKSQQRNFSKWNVLNRRVYLEQFLFSTYAAGVDYLKKYVHERISFLDRSFMVSGAVSEIENIREGVEYMIVHYVGLFATPESSNFYIENPDIDRQKFTFVKSPDGKAWNIKTYDGRLLASLSNDKYCTYTTNGADSHACFTVEASPFDGYARIKNLYTKQYLGIEHTAHYSRVSTNKSGNESNQAWKIIPVERQDGITVVVADSKTLEYDSLSQSILSDGSAEVTVYSLDGRLAIKASAKSLSVAALPSGAYVAVADGYTPLKFVKN